MKKYELTNEFIETNGIKLFYIKALIDFADIKAGDLGGCIEKEANLSQNGDAWVYGDAKVCGDAKVYGNAWVCGDAKVCGDADYAAAKGFGSVYRTSTFFRTKDNIAVKCGCFYGTLDEFRSKVKETHGESKTAKEYLMLADLMEYKFSS